METGDEIIKVFGNRLRIRTCGICIREGSILLVKHSYLGPKGFLWAPPGGGIEFGEQATDSLKREFMEEAGLEITVTEFLFVNEYIKDPLHAIELFFLVAADGPITQGSDPEMHHERQIIKEVRFVPFTEMVAMDKDTLHGALHNISSPEELFRLKGHYLA